MCISGCTLESSSSEHANFSNESIDFLSIRFLSHTKVPQLFLESSSSEHANFSNESIDFLSIRFLSHTKVPQLFLNHHRKSKCRYCFVLDWTMS